MQDDLHWVQELVCSELFLPRCQNNFKDMKKLVDFLREARLEKNYKQDYVAEKLGVTGSTISRWESGETELTLQQVSDYAQVLNIKIKDLFAFLANEGNKAPIAEVHLMVFTNESYEAIMRAISELGTDVSITSKVNI
ncbi:XRE family transcriptional regulator [Bacteroides heparinolyticus]|uniref:XRE family transcriptional regulator n=2 Tax=Bacteroidia TaxID=200643 RepID=A0A3P2ACV5_9BACE|nr:XRE family transcriptional regulator [Bacteroides heparinolyticus]